MALVYFVLLSQEIIPAQIATLNWGQYENYLHAFVHAVMKSQYWSLWTSTLPSALEMLTERRNKNQKKHSEKVHSFFLNSDYTKV